MIAIVYSVVFSAQVPMSSPDKTLNTVLLTRVGSFLLSVFVLGLILLLERSVLFGFVNGSSQRDAVGTVRRLGGAVAGIAVSYAVWLLSIYFPERNFADAGFGRVANRLWRELILLHVLAAVVALVGPVFDSALGVLVIVTGVKVYVGVTFGHSIQLFGSESESGSADTAG